MIFLKFFRGAKFKSKGITSRRIKAAQRALSREQEKYPLLREWVKSSQPTPEKRIHDADVRTVLMFQRLRNYDAKCWREGRKKLRQLPPNLRQQVISEWNNSHCPKTGEYFADFLKRYFKKNPDKLQEKQPMNDLFQQHLNAINEEISDYEIKLETKKQEAAKITQLQNEAMTALSDLQSLINNIQQVDPTAIETLHSATKSIFESNDASINDVDFNVNQQAEAIDCQENNVDEEKPVVLSDNIATSSINKVLENNTTIDTQENKQKALTETTYNQMVKIIGGRSERYIGQIGTVITPYNDSAYIRLQNGDTLTVWLYNLAEA